MIVAAVTSAVTEHNNDSRSDLKDEKVDRHHGETCWSHHLKPAFCLLCQLVSNPRSCLWGTNSTPLEITAWEVTCWCVNLYTA